MNFTQTISAREGLRGIAAELLGSGHLSRPGRNRIKAASAKFSAREGLRGNEAGIYSPGQGTHLSGNLIKAAYSFLLRRCQRSQALWARRMRYVNIAVPKARAANNRQSVVFIAGGSPMAVSIREGGRA